MLVARTTTTKQLIWESAMMVEIRTGLDQREIVGTCATYSDALALAMRTIRRLEGSSMSTSSQWVEIFDGDKLLMSELVEALRHKR
jgi:hypothetical protein